MNEGVKTIVTNGEVSIVRYNKTKMYALEETNLSEEYLQEISNFNKLNSKDLFLATSNSLEEIEEIYYNVYLKFEIIDPVIF